MKDKRAEFQTVDLGKHPPSAAEIKELCRKLGVSPREILRTRDPAYDELGLASGKYSDGQLYEIMSKHPGLIQRPILVKGNRALIARPAEAAAELLE